MAKISKKRQRKKSHLEVLRNVRVKKLKNNIHDAEEDVQDEVEEEEIISGNNENNVLKEEKISNDDDVNDNSNNIEENDNEDKEIATSENESILPEWEKLYKINPKILKALKELGFESPTKIQSEVIPVALLQRRDIVGASETGSGKTLSFGIPIIQQILEIHEKDEELNRGKDENIRALIMAPTRELAVQIVEHLKAVAKYTDINIVPVIGGIAVPKQERLLSNSPHIVVATPGRFWDIISTSELEIRLDLSHLRFLVFDEADKMIEFGRYRELTDILRAVYSSREPEEEFEKPLELDKSGPLINKIQTMNVGEIEKLIGFGGYDEITDVSSIFYNEDEDNENQEETQEKKSKNRHIKPLQTFLFSATLMLSEEMRNNLKKKKKKINKYKKIKQTKTQFDKLLENIKFERKVKIIDLTPKEVVATNLKETKIYCTTEEKDYYLYYILTKHPGRTLVFVNAITNLKRIVPLLNTLKLKAWGIHANMQQRQRLKNLDRFKSHENCVLISTDVMARGLDIPEIDHVIHYQIPTSVDLYVHRSGRTARANSSGVSVCIVDPQDKKNFNTIMYSLQKEKELPDFPFDYSMFKEVKKRVNIARRLSKLIFTINKEKERKSWIKKTANDLDAEIPPDLLDETESEEILREKKVWKERYLMEKHKLKTELDELLSKPMLSIGVSPKYITKNPHIINELKQ